MPEDHFDTVDLSNVEESRAPEAPASDPEPLTGKEKAGVSLTWGIIWVLAGFVGVMLFFLAAGEYRYHLDLQGLRPPPDANAAQLERAGELMAAADQKQASFRAFWMDTLQLIMLNVLFPTLTALLGYVFGTSRNSAAGGDEG